MLAFGHAEEGLDRHEKRREQDDSTNGKGNVGVALSPSHEDGQSNLTKVGRDKADHKADGSILGVQESKDNKGRGRCKTGKENHARGRCRCHGRMNIHGQHERTLDNATT